MSAPVGDVVRDTWGRIWLESTLLIAAALTIFDAILLQQKKGFFTGGFLSSIHTSGVAEAVAFLAISLVSDISAAALLVAAAMWLAGRLRLTRAARRVAVLVVAGAPLIIADFVMYRLLSYVGDAFDLSLMFDLTNRSAAEMLAVSARHLVGPSLVLAAVGGVASVLIWGVNRCTTGEAAAKRVPARAFVVSALVMLIGCVTSAAVRAGSETFEDGLRRKPSGTLFLRLTELATDIDRDGFGAGGRLNDPAPFDAAIFPYAIDTPGDGIDQNGIGGDLPAEWAPYVERTSRAADWAHRPDVVLFVLESFRADAVGRVQNGRAVTPVLDALGRRGASAPLAFSHNGYTSESRFHILSGSLAGLRQGRSLIDDFKANGYEVGYFSGQDDSFGGPTYDIGFNRADVAYDARQDRHRRYSTFTTPGSLAVPHDVVRERVGEFLRTRSRNKPLFLYVNFHDTHYPYHHHRLRALASGSPLSEREIHPSRAAAVQETYYNAAANVDAAIGDTLELVRAHLAGEPAIIVTADHGESLFDEGFLGHGYALNDVQTRIPLIVSGLALDIRQPFGQSELRDAIDAALATGEDAGRPALSIDSQKKIFQYLGTLKRPRQIGFAGAGGRTIYDLRTGRVRFGGEPWTSPEVLQGDRKAEYLELVRLWERMMVAQQLSSGRRPSR